MTDVVAPPVSAVVAGLSRWASGFPADEAAVGLLVRVAADHPEVLDPDGPWREPWVVRCPRPGWWCLDGAALAVQIEVAPGQLPARVLPVLTLVSGLAVDGALVDLGVTLAAVPPEWQGPVFDALAHAAGYHPDQEPPPLPESVQVGPVDASAAAPDLGSAA